LPTDHATSGDELTHPPASTHAGTDRPPDAAPDSPPDAGPDSPPDLLPDGIGSAREALRGAIPRAEPDADLVHRPDRKHLEQDTRLATVAHAAEAVTRDGATAASAQAGQSAHASLSTPPTTAGPVLPVYRPGSAGSPRRLPRDPRALVLPQPRADVEPVPHEIASAFQATHGVDVSNVPIHRGPEASSRARSLGAWAFTHRERVFLPAEHGSLQEPTGRALLAHELTHVVQQRTLGSSLPTESSPHGQALEDAARGVGDWFRDGVRSGGPPALTHRPPSVRRPDWLVDPSDYAQQVADELIRGGVAHRGGDGELVLGPSSTAEGLGLAGVQRLDTDAPTSHSDHLLGQQRLVEEVKRNLGMDPTRTLDDDRFIEEMVRLQRGSPARAAAATKDEVEEQRVESTIDWLMSMGNRTLPQFSQSLGFELTADKIYGGLFGPSWKARQVADHTKPAEDDDPDQVRGREKPRKAGSAGKTTPKTGGASSRKGAPTGTGTAGTRSAKAAKSTGLGAKPGLTPPAAKDDNEDEDERIESAQDWMVALGNRVLPRLGQTWGVEGWSGDAVLERAYRKPEEEARAEAAAKEQALQALVEAKERESRTPRTSTEGARLAKDVDMDELVRRLWPRLRTRLRQELLVDRERAGMLTDFR
jgi:hypothetical protein